MPLIETTLGPIDSVDFGRVNAHEHVIHDRGYIVQKSPGFTLKNVQKSIEQVELWKQAGGGLIIEAGPIGVGRNVNSLITVSEATGIPIAVCTGFHKVEYYLKDHWIHYYSVDDLAALLTQEFEQGVEINNYDGPIIKRSHVKPSHYKVAGDYNFIDDTKRKLIQAVGNSHQVTGAPILVHTEMGTYGAQLVDHLVDAGFAPEKIRIDHLDRNPDMEVQLDVVKRGAFLSYDTPARIKYQPESIVVALTRQLFERGFGDRVMFGGDMVRPSYLPPYGGGPGYHYLITGFTERLRKGGLSDDELDMIWVKNPARWLAGAL